MEGIRILLYHSVGEIDPRDDLGIRVDKEGFRAQMRSLKERGCTVCLLKDAVECIKNRTKIPQKTVAVTFDDGYKDNIQNAAPILQEFGFRATFFITVDYIGKVKTSPRRDWQRWECLDWGDLKALSDMGHDIGSHGLHHIDLTKISYDAKVTQLKISKETLSAFLNKKIELFSYPYGYFDDELIRIAEETGYKAACTTTPGLNDHAANLYKLKRGDVSPSSNSII